MSTHNDEDSFADDIIQVSGYAAPRPKQKKFLPWHLPRKQYVRHHQWTEQIAKLLDEHPPKDNTLKYLGLPGLDLLDLRHFHSTLCETRRIGLRFLGFNSSARPSSEAQTELNISLDEVRRLDRVDPLSEVIGDNFSLVAQERSIAFRKAKEFGPFDVINLDLCDGFAAQSPEERKHNYYQAMASLLAIQSRSKTPWLLLLTTRVDKANIDSGLLDILLKKYAQNLDSSAAFRDASKDAFAIEDEVELRDAALTEAGLPSVFLTALCKWFLGLTLNQSPPSLLELKSAIGYKVEHQAQHDDLVSLAIRFSPTFAPPADPLGIATAIAPTPDEATLATKALRRISKRLNADVILAQDADLNRRMATRTVELLESARYEVAGYDGWVADEVAAMNS